MQHRIRLASHSIVLTLSLRRIAPARHSPPRTLGCARDFVGDVPSPRSAPLLQWIQLLESPNAAVAMLALNPGMPVEPDALVAGFSRLSIADSAASGALLRGLLMRPDLTPAVQTRLQRAAALGAAYARAPNAIAALHRIGGGSE